MNKPYGSWPGFWQSWEASCEAAGDIAPYYEYVQFRVNPKKDATKDAHKLITAKSTPVCSDDVKYE